MERQRELTGEFTNHAPQLLLRCAAQAPEDQAVGCEFWQKRRHRTNGEHVISVPVQP